MCNRGCRAVMILGPWWVISNLTDFYVKKITALLWTRPILNADVLITMTASTQAEQLRFRMETYYTTLLFARVNALL